MINYDIPNSVSDYQASAPKSNLKGFDDLCFQTHDGKARQARLKFGSRDQFEISVVQNLNDGNGLYGHIDDNAFEVAMWYDGRDTMLPLSVGDDVLAYQSPTDITRLMHQAHLNDFAWVCLLTDARKEHNKELGLDNLDQY
jgi:hypothetical protein